MKNREIKFRGLNQSNELVYGDLMYGVGSKSGNVYILPRVINLAKIKHCDPLDGVKVNPDSVGQFTGLHDKNGKEIYEGDIVGGYPHGTVLVKYNDEWACFESCITELDFDSNGEPYKKEITSLFANDLKDCFNEWEVIGNVFENPELLSDKH